MRKSTVFLAIALTIISILYLTVQHRENLILKGARDGYIFNGIYRDTQMNTFAVLEQTTKWQFRNADSMITGAYQKTDDPNFYLLYDRDRNEVGNARLSYAMPDGTSGLIYVTIHGKTLALDKITRNPMFVVENKQGE
ncbi:hypothetical protein KPC83_05520 [Collinsella sp. zg1085]|uniref:hypothetical protein n=1 Tax=Collinsella sp. zg1085 TaxID=2844380 RepID=UPI001C0E1F94|nr:hypothetical protein [Collinsella sp. zg1085]QWT17301.1 hypothetical protein KPC83_05520 [Collinsella sp. zg1085]